MASSTPESAPSPQGAKIARRNIIRLDRAFRWVLACFEEADGVEPSERLGLFPGQADPFEAPGTPEGTGPAQYRRGFTDPPEPSKYDVSWLKTVYVPPPQIYVPLVPDNSELDRLLQWLETPDPELTPAERRVCDVHFWLLRALRDGKVESWADRSINPNNRLPPVPAGRAGPVTSGWRSDLELDYHDAFAFSRSRVWTYRVGVTVRGGLRLENVMLDENQLRDQLAAWLNGATEPEPEPRPQARLTITTGDNGRDTCEVCCGGTFIAVDLTGKERVAGGCVRS